MKHFSQKLYLDEQENMINKNHGGVEKCFLDKRLAFQGMSSFDSALQFHVRPRRNNRQITLGQ